MLVWHTGSVSGQVDLPSPIHAAPERRKKAQQERQHEQLVVVTAEPASVGASSRCPNQCSAMLLTYDDQDQSVEFHVTNRGAPRFSRL